MAHGGDPNFDLVVGKNVITQGLAEFERIRIYLFFLGGGAALCLHVLLLPSTYGYVVDFFFFLIMLNYIC